MALEDRCSPQSAPSPVQSPGMPNSPHQYSNSNIMNSDTATMLNHSKFNAKSNY